MNTHIDLHIEEKSYNKGTQPVPALHDFHLAVGKGERIALVGASGVGKSTLLNILGLIDHAYQGTYTLNGQDTRNLSSRERAKFRNQHIGFVLQESALINSLSIRENIELPLMYARTIQANELKERTQKIASSIGIDTLLDKKPLACSGGERARAVFARAVLMRPGLILADEPTASLDEDHKRRIMNLLFDMNKTHQSTIITVTHDKDIAKLHDRIIHLT